jgi:hypothetical protein
VSGTLRRNMIGWFREAVGIAIPDDRFDWRRRGPDVVALLCRAPCAIPEESLRLAKRRIEAFVGPELRFLVVVVEPEDPWPKGSFDACWAIWDESGGSEAGIAGVGAYVASLRQEGSASEAASAAAI